MAVADEVADKMAALPESAQVSLRTTVSAYLDAVRGVIDNFATKRGLDTIYVTSAIPAQSIVSALQMLEVDLTRVYLVDCVSQTLMGPASKSDKITHVESPSMLENIMLKIEFHLRRKGHGSGRIVVLDSINTLAIHNSPKMLSEFLHILVNNMRVKNVYTVILNMVEHGSSEIDNMLNLVCDDSIAVDDGGRGA